MANTFRDACNCSTMKCRKIRIACMIYGGRVGCWDGRSLSWASAHPTHTVSLLLGFYGRTDLKTMINFEDTSLTQNFSISHFLLKTCKKEFIFKKFKQMCFDFVIPKQSKIQTPPKKSCVRI